MKMVVYGFNWNNSFCILLILDERLFMDGRIEMIDSNFFDMLFCLLKVNVFFLKRLIWERRMIKEDWIVNYSKIWKKKFKMFIVFY